MYNILSFVTLLLSCLGLLRIIRPAGAMELVLAFYCLSAAHIVIGGNLLSLLNRLDSTAHWSLLGLIAALASSLIAYWKSGKLFMARPAKTPGARPTPGVLADAFAFFKAWRANEISRFEKALLTPLVFTVLLLGVANFIVIIFSAPHNWDSMTYHLARVAYYLQHADTNSFGANFWAQVVPPRNSSLLLLYTYLISERSENLTQLVQFFSYGVAVCSIYAISRKIGNSATQSIFAATTGALLTEWLMQATTTQNDLILTACTGATVYFLFAFKESREDKYLVLTALALGLAIGTKASSFLPALCTAPVALHAVFSSSSDWQRRRRDLFVLASCVLLGVCIFALPSGYYENYRDFGHPIGPEKIRTMHSFEGMPAGRIAANGTKNLVRYGFDFLSLDGLPAVDPVRKVQAVIRFVPEKLIRGLGINLESSEATRAPFQLHKLPSSHEDNSYWGILGFGLVWVTVLLSLVGAIKSAEFRVLSFAALLFLIVQSYVGPYDPWRGRYFTVCAIFAVPTVGAFLPANARFLRAYLLLVVWIGCVSAMAATALRYNSALFSLSFQGRHRKSIFIMDRIEQLTRNRTPYREALNMFDRLTPGNARVAVSLPENSFEYPLFGERLTRTIMPINHFMKGLQPIPPRAEYLLYAKSEFPCALPDDVHLGADWYLRRLTYANRKCP